MFQPISFYIGLRYSRSQKGNGFVSFITFFSVIGILLGVAALITVVSVMDGLEAEQKRRVLGLVPHILMSSKQPHFSHWQQTQSQLVENEHVLHVTPFQETEALIQSSTALRGVLVHGINSKYEQHHIINTVEPNLLDKLRQQKYSIIIGQALARRLNVDIGSMVRITLPNKTYFTPMGRVPVQRNFTVAAIFNIGSNVDESMVFININDGAKLLRQRNDGVQQLRLYLDDAFFAPKLIAQLAQQYPEHQFVSWQQSQGALFSAVSMEKNMMWLMLSLIIAVAAFNIISGLIMVVVDKQGEISILQTLGLTKAEVVKIFITQGLTNGVVGISLGLLVGVLLTLNLNQILSALNVSLLGVGQQLPIVIDIGNIMVIVISSLLMCFLATLYPSIKAASTQPAKVLRNE